MIKKDIVEAIYLDHGGFTRAEVDRFVNQMMDLISEGLAADGSVSITDFGRFQYKQKPLREVNLPDGTKIQTQGGTRIQFLPGADLKTRINGALPRFQEPDTAPEG